MSDLFCEFDGPICSIIFNRPNKHNAFDNSILDSLHTLLLEIEKNPSVRIIILKSSGKHFSAGADLEWMQRMATFSEEENINDAMVLGQTLFALYHSSKTTIAMVQGAAFGGGAGLVAACDIAIGSHSATFSFSEVKLGLIPAVISPYVIKAIGERNAAWLFMSAEVLSAQQALNLGLLHYEVSNEELELTTEKIAKNLLRNAPNAVKEVKTLVRQVADQKIDKDLMYLTAKLIAKKRVSREGQEGLHAFLTKTSPGWNG